MQFEQNYFAIYLNRACVEGKSPERFERTLKWIPALRMPDASERLYTVNTSQQVRKRMSVKVLLKETQLKIRQEKEYYFVPEV